MNVDIIIAGAQKCGTTALHSFLSEHPKIVGSSPKEIDFFNYDKNFDKGISRYHSKYFNKPFLYKLKRVRFMEASPSYIADSNKEITAQRIYEYNPDIKIISLVRDPILRAFSAWNMYKKRFEEGNINWWFDWIENKTGKASTAKRRNPIEYESFTEFIKRELDCTHSQTKIECSVLSIGEYYTGIEVFKKQFSNNYLVIKNEDLNDNTSEVLKKVTDFLELRPYKWQKFDNVKVFKGNYLNNIEKEAIVLLKDYYKFANERLYELTGIHY